MREYPLYYVLVGLLYWAYNLVVRKLHTKNDPGDGWWLATFWLLGWPLCFAMLIAGAISDKVAEIKNRI
jgi:hypothetical protein